MSTANGPPCEGAGELLATGLRSRRKAEPQLLGVPGVGAVLAKECGVERIQIIPSAAC